MSRRLIEYRVIPPQSDAECVAHTELVLDLYQQPYDPDCPVVCMDEQPVQLVKEMRQPVAAAKAQTPHWRPRDAARLSAWSSDINGTQRAVDWQMKVDAAR